MTDSPDTTNMNAEPINDRSINEAVSVFRAEFASGAQNCRHAVLTPKNTLGLSHELRNAIARRIAHTAAHPNSLLADYPNPNDKVLEQFAAGGACNDMQLNALAAHVDMIAAEPAKASKEHLDSLQSAGFSVPQIIAISELCAYVCFQIRLIHGISLLEITP